MSTPDVIKAVRMEPLLIPLSIPIAAFAIAYRFRGKVPWGSSIYRLHTLVYLLVVTLSLGVMGLIRASRELDWWVNDGAMFLILLFGTSGLMLCVLSVPITWWGSRRATSAGARAITQAIATIVSIVPYFLLAGVLLFYRE